MANLDLAGVIGTWVAAGLAVIALIGIIGPLLVYRAVRRERHQAIVAIGLSSNNYISAGYPVWPGVRFWQRTRAPKVDIAKVFDDAEWRTYEPERLSRIETDAPSWVHLGACLEAYSVKCATGDSLVISSKRAYLPVHQHYLRVLCLVGRFKKSGERGLLRIRRVSTGSAQEINIRRNEYDDTEHDSRSLSSGRSSNRSYELLGTSGILRIVSKFSGADSPSGYQGARVLSFTPTPGKSSIKHLSERVSLPSLMLLSKGYIPGANDVYYCLLAGQDVTDHSEHLWYNDSSSESTAPLGMPGMVMPERQTVDHTYVRRRDRYHSYGRRRDRNRNPRHEWTAWEFRQDTLDGDTQKSILLYEPVTVHVLYMLKHSSSLTSEIESSVGATYVRPSEPWVRVNSVNANGNDEFIRRADAQALAMALLKMDWHPQSYVLDGLDSTDSPAVLLLKSASKIVEVFVQRVAAAAADFNWIVAERSEFVAAANAMLKRPKSSIALFDLDKVLSKLEHDDPRLNYMVGILTITNEEFRTLLHRSTHDLRAALQSKTEIDVRAGRIKIRAAFNVLQTFEVDVDKLGIGHSQSRPAVIDSSHAYILVAALRACLRSAMLDTCIDPKGINRFFRHEDEVFLVQ